MFLAILLISGCSNEDQRPVNVSENFREAGIAYQNGDFDKAVNYYKQFLSSDSDANDALLQYANLQLARISYSKGYFNEAINYARRVRNSELFYRAFWQKEETYFIHSMKGLLTDKETDKINSFGYSLRNNALTIIGLSYLKTGDFENAILNFKEIEPKADGYYYLAISYGLKGDLMNEGKYYKLNLKDGDTGLIETREWINNNSSTK
jgi:tetratricopeptide (TPR) repeat protein